MRDRMTGPALLALLAAGVSGCGSKRVMVPPRIDLQPLEVIGIIEFSSSNRGRLGPEATRRFLEAMRRDQGMVRIVEMGPEPEVLRDVGRSQLDRDAFLALGEKHGVSTIITGALTVTDVKPAIRIAPGLGDLGVAADVDATLVTRIVEVSSRSVTVEPVRERHQARRARQHLRRTGRGVRRRRPGPRVRRAAGRPGLFGDERFSRQLGTSVAGGAAGMSGAHLTIRGCANPVRMRRAVAGRKWLQPVSHGDQLLHRRTAGRALALSRA